MMAEPKDLFELGHEYVKNYLQDYIVSYTLYLQILFIGFKEKVFKGKTNVSIF